MIPWQLFKHRNQATIFCSHSPLVSSRTQMLSLTLPIPLLKTLTPPSPNINNPSLSSYSHYQPRSRSLTRGLIVPKHSSATAPPSATLRDDGTSLAGDSPEPLPEELVAELMPKHVAVIIDGHGRWAKLRGLPASAGHQAGVQPLRTVVRLCCSWGIQVLTVFVLSTENWFRPKVILVFSFPTAFS